jgi:Domain of unknown function (DUF4168)
MTGFRMAALAAAFIATAATPALAQQSRPGAASPQTPSAPGTALQQDDLSDAMVHKVGAALRQTVTIRQKFAERAQATKSQEQQEALTAQAQTEMMQAISDQGLSVQQYNQVIQMAQADPTLKQRVLSAAQSGG